MSPRSPLVHVGTSARVRMQREALALSEHAVASVAGISDAAYSDIEAYDDELATAVTIRQAESIARALQVSLLALLGEAAPVDSVSDAALREAVARRVEGGPENHARFEELCGWAVGPLLLETPTYAHEYPLWALADVCDAVGIDWRAVIAGRRPA